MIWTARLRTGRVVTFRASGSKDFRAAALIVSVAAEDLAVIDLVAAVEDLVVIASVAVVDLAAVALAVLAGAVADFAVAAAMKINARNFPILFLEKIKPQN